MIGFERYVREIDFIQKWVSFLSSITFDCLQRDLLMDFLFFRVSVGVTSGNEMAVSIFRKSTAPMRTSWIQWTWKLGILVSGARWLHPSSSQEDLGRHHAQKWTGASEKKQI